MSIREADWEFARRTVRRCVRSSLHCAVASRNTDGTPHVTPIGSLLLDAESHTGLYFDVFNTRLAHNVGADPRVAVLAVDSGPIRWLNALARGGFRESPGVRLTGTVSTPRRSTPDEIARFRAVVGPLMRLPGARIMWGDLPRVRDIRFESVERIRLGTMTRGPR
ncbi:pyridoxamine 5'-phosphate oxidase family protein [Tsukamurella sp. 8F]|uniref:pyridoxamine 5'-phosphate oxidase family protein n=1 Tax=unclassified Tsukamurella TaxID=2633480 RepID=UPI0023B88D08|nr:MULTISPECIES: pyridoxamine 5'-phosphate oxidase family protein [unclassified Tsukamurella]MDF0532470.1 pyridoxamine 5'-phosphate oxidase family protein [Tsukamurella sp. 8J]MDF0589329.1 pyridoxamine 5'-phosphate oxidase family protein [Tsukamurella sp. 8F]